MCIPSRALPHAWCKLFLLEEERRWTLCPDTCVVDCEKMLLKEAGRATYLGMPWRCCGIELCVIEENTILFYKCELILIAVLILQSKLTEIQPNCKVNAFCPLVGICVWCCTDVEPKNYIVGMDTLRILIVTVVLSDLKRNSSLLKKMLSRT